MTTGIYVIVNKVNDKIYIGSSCNIDKRIKDHFKLLYNNKHHSIHLQNAFNKYKDENFQAYILEECKIEELLDREQYYLNLYLEADKYLLRESNVFIEKGYNICPLSIKGFTGKHSKESILKQIKTRGFCEIYRIDINGNILDIYDLKSDCPDKISNVYKSIKTKICLKSKNYCYINATDYFDGFKPEKFIPWNKNISTPYNGKTKTVYVYDIYGTFINKFDSLIKSTIFLESDSPNILRKINKYPNKILIDSKSSRYIIYDTFESNEIIQVRNKWANIFNQIKQNKTDKLKVIDCFNNYIGTSNIEELSNLLEVKYSSIQTNIYKNRRIKSLSIIKL